jgi:SAM-dependent methyltransferase
MEVRNQISNVTAMNRYPSIFGGVKRIVSEHTQTYPLSILSFGCSTGEEVRTLKEMYFQDCKITGVDISETIIEKNKLENTDPDVTYVTPSELKHSQQQFDIIFCMSVLCIHCSGKQSQLAANGYLFDTFERTLVDLHQMTKIGGFLVIYNEAYLFHETCLRDMFETICVNGVTTGFVARWKKDGTLVEGKSPMHIFRRIK